MFVKNLKVDNYESSEHNIMVVCWQLIYINSVDFDFDYWFWFCNCLVFSIIFYLKDTEYDMTGKDYEIHKAYGQEQTLVKVNKLIN